MALTKWEEMWEQSHGLTIVRVTLSIFLHVVCATCCVSLCVPERYFLTLILGFA